MRKLDIDACHAIALKKGGRCLSLQYLGVEAKYTWECTVGHVWVASYTNVRNRTWCPSCSRRTFQKWTVDDMVKLATDRGFQFLSVDYHGSTNKHKWGCSLGHDWMARPSSIKRGDGCPSCAKVRPLTLRQLKDTAKSKGGRLVTGSLLPPGSKYRWQCSKGHQWEASPYWIRSGTMWCPMCSRKWSMGEQTLRKKVREIYPDAYEFPVKGLLSTSSFEFDIWVPSKKLAIEYNGDYWHSIEKVRLRDFRKREEALDRGILICTVWDSKFKENPGKETLRVLAWLESPTREHYNG